MMLSKIPSLNMRWGLKFAEAVTQAAYNSPFFCFTALAGNTGMWHQAQSHCSFKYKICIHDKKKSITPPKIETSLNIIFF